MIDALNRFSLPTIVAASPADAALPSAVRWVEGTLTGPFAIGTAVLAVAFVGFGMLAGRLDWRVGSRVVLGVFILFGSPVIARELMALARGGEAAVPGEVVAGAVPLEPEVPEDAPDADPYAGAGLPQR